MRFRRRNTVLAERLRKEATVLHEWGDRLIAEARELETGKVVFNDAIPGATISVPSRHFKGPDPEAAKQAFLDKVKAEMIVKGRLLPDRSVENGHLRKFNSYYAVGKRRSFIDGLRAITALLHRLRRLEARVRKLEGD